MKARVHKDQSRTHFENCRVPFLDVVNPDGRVDQKKGGQDWRKGDANLARPKSLEDEDSSHDGTGRADHNT